jgi:hypothetical protein
MENKKLIDEMLRSFTSSNEQLINVLIQLQYYMRGAMSRDDVWALSPSERDLYLEFINKRFKDAGEMIKKQIPVFI